MQHSRLDILLYAHDGRGLGHTSRSIAIGMALRRLYPEFRVLFVSGSVFSAELIGPVSLDWLKLPAYATHIKEGTSKGISGASRFTDKELGVLRARALQQIVQLYQPRVVLCDHSPLGKHRELRLAQDSTEYGDTRWILGVRGVVGQVPQVFSDHATSIFKQHFHQLLWYGDTKVLGAEPLLELQQQFNIAPLACGYVSRLKELLHWQTPQDLHEKQYAGVISIPWLGEQSHCVVRHLAKALKRIDPNHGLWQIFLGSGPQHKSLENSFSDLSHVRVQPPGHGYIKALTRAKTALIYGGYNSITDLLCLNLPAVVLLREMSDDEQQLHLTLLARHSGQQFQFLPEETVNPDILERLLREQLTRQTLSTPAIELNGAENAAQQLAQQRHYHKKKEDNK